MVEDIQNLGGVVPGIALVDDVEASGASYRHQFRGEMG